ncbi:MAG: hypothetical protein Q9163_001782 [Psora crenata]
MSLLGSNLGSGSHPSQAPGFGTVSDPFASISHNRADDDDEGIDFEDTYDGLGERLDEADDDLNEDTFGGGGEALSKPPGKDFDFYGSTSKVSGVINEEAVRYNRHNQPASKPLVSFSGPAQKEPRPLKTGYEAYKNSGSIPDLRVDPSLWETGPSQQLQGSTRPQGSQQQKAHAVPQKKMMSLEEVEAAMRAQPKKASLVPQTQQQFQPLEPSSYPAPQMRQQHFQFSRSLSQQDTQCYPPSMQVLQPPHHEMPQSQVQAASVIARQQRASPRPALHAQRPPQSSPLELPIGTSPAPQPSHATQIMQRGQAPTQHLAESHMPQPRQILQNPNRHSANLDYRSAESPVPVQQQPMMIMRNQNGEPISLPIITHPSQLVHLTEEQRQAFMAEEAKRAKRNHKIYLLSKGNGLMTPQDKNFITRIQLQQLMTATNNVSDQDPDVFLAEDFYYQVYNQIENRPRQHPNQPLSNFAQTYLFQTGGRHGGIGRRHNRGENHIHRMQQQVQRAVEAAKVKPKNKQLVIEGSLGKISFSNAKTPKPLLNLKRNESSEATPRPASKKLSQPALNAVDRKTILKNVEAVYASLMNIEDHDRRIPHQPLNDHDPASAEPYVQWRHTFKELNRKLWFDLKVMEPIMPESALLHPFIAFLSYPKGKKAIPRVFNHLDQEQRLTILTMIMIQLDTLDVTRSAEVQSATTQASIIAREQVDLFLQTVMPSLLSNVTEASLSVIIGLVGLVIDQVNVPAIARSQVGLEMLTMLLSQAEIIRKADATNDHEWQQWLGIYSRLFDTMEPLLAEIFPRSVNVGQDVYVWQFLASIGTGANPDQQQRLVLAVKDRVMDTVQQSKTLPPDMAAQRRGNVNLFMQAIGLDVDLLDG